MAERRRGNLGGALRSGALLDQLVVRIDVDLSGFRRGIGEVIAQINTLRGVITGQTAGVGLGDAMTAALVAPMAVAAARIGQVRNEIRALSNEVRNMPALGFGGPAAGGRSMGALIVPTPGGPVIDATRATGADGRPVVTRGSGGRFVRSYNAGGSDDLLGAATGAALGAAAGGEGRRRRTFGDWFRGERQRTSDAYSAGRDNFPGYGEAADDLGMSAHRAGQGIRRGAGGRIASILGLTGLGALFGDLIGLAGALARILGGVLTGAFAALATPLGAVVALVTALVGLFVAANWDQFREFGEWFANRWRDIIAGEGMGDIIAGWNNLKDAFGELWTALMRIFSEDESASITTVLQFFGEVAIRVLNAVMEVIGTFLNVLAEVVRAIAALLSGDLVGAFEHMGQAVGHVFQGLLDTLGSLFPEIQNRIDGFANWVTERFQSMTDAIGTFFGALNGGSGGGQPAVNRYRGGGKSNGGGGKSSMGGGGATVGDSVGWAPAAEIERGVTLANEFGRTIGDALGAMATNGERASDIFRSLLSQLVSMTAQAALLEPLSNMLGNLFGGGGGGVKGANDNSGGGFWNSILQGLAGSGSAAGGIGGGFGGFFAKGGFLKPGQWGIVGEAGAEIVKAGPGGASITPVNDNMRIDARAFIDARGADSAAIARLEAALARRDAELPARIRAQVGDMGARGRLRYS